MASSITPAAALRRFGLRQTIKGALILGISVGLFVTVQGLGYAKTFADERSRMDLAASLTDAPALGILYGEPKELLTTSGYMVYRTVAILALITSLWGLMTATKLLRGQEEDGRTEAIITGSTTNRHASWNMFLGYIGSMVVSFSLAALIIIGCGRIPGVDTPVLTCILIAAMIYLPSLLFASLGVLVSQFSVIRRRALMYGLVPLVILFALRGIANTMSDWYWLKNITPFGWVDKFSPVADTQLAWILPFLITIPILVLGIYFAGKRDLGASLIKESLNVKSHYFLLKTYVQLAIRQQLGIFIGWSIAAVAVSAIIAAVADIAAKAVADAPQMVDIIAKLGNSIGDIKVAFLGTGTIFIVLLLLIMATVGLGAIRRDEAMLYLDNLLVQPVRRSVWLANRLGILLGAALFISLISGLATLLIGGAIGIDLDASNLFAVCVALIGTIVFTLGIGTFVYGILPRLATLAMYVVIAWSFTIDIVASVVKLDDIFIKSSLFHYVSSSPSEVPNWATFAWLVGIGLVMAAIGIATFTRRDIVPE